MSLSMEMVAIAGSSAAGIISAAVIQKMTQSRRSIAKTEKPVQPSQAPTPNAQHPSPVNSVASAKAELAALSFEKSLCSESIARVYEAAQNGRVDRMERDRLLLKYKKQLESINARLSQLQSVADYADMTEMRNNLVSILESRISAIDTKLSEISRRGMPDVLADSQLKKIVEEIAVKNEPEKPEEPPAINVESNQLISAPEEKSIAQLQEEIVQALKRLEQVEVDKD